MPIACCQCGALIEPNAINTCLACVTQFVERKAADTPLRGALNRCQGCERVQLRGGGKRQWHAYAHRSPEMQRLCTQSLGDLLNLGNLGTNAATLIDAEFAQGEDSETGGEMELQLRLGFQFGDFSIEVERPAVVAFEDVVCEECEPTTRGWSWRAFVQLRYKSEHRRAFYRLEQGLLKNNATSDGIAAVKGGLDLCFASKTRAERFVQLVSELSPVRIKSSSKTRSEDLSQHTANVQTTYCVELCPIAQYDLVLLPKKLVQSLGVPRVAVCTQTAGQLHFVDPTSGKAFDLSRDRYWQLEFPPWETSANLAEFVVLDIEEPERSSSKDGAARSGARDVEVARVRDFGVNDVTFIVRSHLADELEVGDHVKGYDIASANVRTYIAYSLDQSDMPEIVLVRSTVGDKAADGSEDAETVALKRLVDDSDGYKTGKAEAREFDAFAADWADEQQQLALAA